MAGRRPRELYRDPARGKVAGICAGLARYFDWPVWPIRLALVVLAVFTQFFPLFAVYLIAWFVLDPVSDYSPPGLRGRVDGWVRHSRERWEDGQGHAPAAAAENDGPVPERDAPERPDVTIRDAAYAVPAQTASLERLTSPDIAEVEAEALALEQRIQRLERHVTAPAFVLRQQFQHL